MWMREIKDKIIEKYNKLVSRLEKGYKDDYYDIIDMICLVEFEEDIDNSKSLYEYYINL